MKDACIVRVRRLDCPIISFDWPFARSHATAIAAHWAGLTVKNPTLFNGRIFLSRSISVEEDCFRACYFETDFAAFIAWRDFGFPDASVFNSFGMAALQSYDDAYLLGEMAAHTSTAGLCYFPAGTPDRSDCVDNAIDLAGSIARELLEETGISLDEGVVDPVWTVVKRGQRIACMRGLRLTLDAAKTVMRVQAFLAQEKLPEICRLHPVRSLADLDALKTPDFIGAFLGAEFTSKI